MTARSGYSKKQRTSDEPFQGGVLVTPDDTNPLPVQARGLWVGVGGTLRVDLFIADGSTTATVNTTCDGGLFPFVVAKVHATGTTASQIVAGY